MEVGTAAANAGAYIVIIVIGVHVHVPCRELTVWLRLHHVTLDAVDNCGFFPIAVPGCHW